MINELIERLRGDKWMPSKTLNIEAADLIEQLQRELRIKDLTIGQMAQDAQNLKAYYEQVYLDGGKRIERLESAIDSYKQQLSEQALEIDDNQNYMKAQQSLISDQKTRLSEAEKLIEQLVEALEEAPIEYDYHGNPMDEKFGLKLGKALVAAKQWKGEA